MDKPENEEEAMLVSSISKIESSPPRALAATVAEDVDPAAASSATAGSILEVRERALARRAAVLGASGTDSVAASSATAASALEVRERALARRAAVLGASVADCNDVGSSS